MRTTVALLAMAAIAWPALSATAQQENAEPQRSNVEERIQVLEEPWKVGDVKTYSLIFDYAPFGRQTIRLDRVTEENGEKVLEFSQMLHLDLRALGQEGSLYNFGTVRYARGKMFRHYKFEEVLKSWAGYTTYEPAGRMRDRTVDIDRGRDGAAVTIRNGKDDPAPRGVPVTVTPDGLDHSVLVDLEIIGHWERLFLFDTWALGEEKDIPMMVPSEPVVYDYHLPVKDFRPISPSLKVARLKVEALENVSVFSVDIPAFRCSIPEIGYTIWVTARGGVIKFDNGKGLTGVLER
ncbi:MAG TPA: hypothetical protein VFE84_02895 [Patescibacteria group bacterium]|nr:hypothetical protein [Patescibacteria group bacterium]